MNAEPTRVRYVVLGIGINVNHTSFTGELEPIATSLRMESGRQWSRVELAAALLKSLDSEYRKFIAGGEAARTAICREFESRSSFARSRYVRVGEDDPSRALPRASTIAGSCWCAPTAACAPCSQAMFAPWTENRSCSWFWMSATPIPCSALSKRLGRQHALRAADRALARDHR